jgi:SagB-type dehydrogenase family enzyme
MPDIQSSIASHYHERTKYNPETIASKSKTLDWANQPKPFKEYKIGNSYELTPHLSRQEDISGDRLSWQRISRLLLCSYGLTAKMPTMYGDAIYLRSAPSAGGLYPAELYLISRGTSILPAGLYNYQAQNHSLVHFWENNIWFDLQAACFDNDALKDTELAFVTTAIFYRSAWRYEDRAYRRIFLDTGHLLGNIELAAAIDDYRPHVIGGFKDEAMNSLLYLDSQQEGVISVIPLVDLLDSRQTSSSESIRNSSTIATTLPSKIQTEYAVVPDGELLYYFHQATQIEEITETIPCQETTEDISLEDKYNFPFCLKVSTQTKPIDWEARLLNLENTILQRRSTRAYSGAELTLDELKALLNFTYQPQDYLEQGLDTSPDYFDLNLIETFIAVSGVNGLEEGCYYYAPKAQELRQVRFKNFRQELHYLCLGQDLGRDAAAVVFHTTDLNKAVAKYGDRVYRYLHMDAGHLGQRLNLAAIYLGLGASGIGGFFDDRVNEVLGIPPEEAVIYITTLGRPLK